MLKMGVAPCWQKRRSVFNHDWLKNQYMVALAKYLNLLEGKIEDRDFEGSFVQSVLPEWELHSREATALAKDFEREMSPRVMFDRYPLSLCDEHTKQWLGNLLHVLWLTRYPVRCWVADAAECAAEAEIAYSQLQESLRSCQDIRSSDALRGYRDKFIDFRARCQDLAKALEKFPSEVRVP